MIAIDTNILVRWIVGDDPVQCRLVESLFEKHHHESSIFISDIVLVEFEWVLESVYKIKREDIAKIFDKMLKTRQLKFRNKDIIYSALRLYQTINKDFSDCLIGLLGGEHHLKTFTFDVALKNDSNFIVLSK